MSEDVICPQCNSCNVIFSKKRQIWQCEDCEQTFNKKNSIVPLRVFISYGRDEYAGFASHLKRDLEARGHQVWFDQDKLREGGDWEHYIDEGLNWVGSEPESGRIVFIMTPHSVRRPDGYCLNEIAKALTTSVLIVPIMLVFSEPPLSIYRVQYLDMQDCYPPVENTVVYEQRFERLITALEEKKIEFDGIQRKLLSSLHPIRFAADMSRLLRDFTGRNWVFEAVESWLKTDEGSKIFWIQGGPGIGKSAIAAWLRDNCREIAAFHFCDINSEEKRDPRKMVASLAYQLSTQLPDYQERLALVDIPGIMEEYGEAYTLFDKLVVQPLAENFPEPDRTIVILIDALDEASISRRNEIAQFLSISALKTPGWLRFLVTSRPEPEITTMFQSLSPLVLDAATDANRRDIAAFLHSKIPAITDEQSASILDKSEGIFLYARYVCDEVQAGRLKLEKLDEFPQGLGEVYTRFFLRQFSHDLEAYKKAIRPMLCVILAAQIPLELALLRKITGCVNRMELFDKLDVLGSLFPRSGNSDSDTIVSFHRSLNDWLIAKDKSGHFYIDRDYGHALLSDYGWAQYLKSTESMCCYFLEWLPLHLFTISEYDKIATLLSDFQFLMQRSRAGYMNRLIKDYLDIVNNLPKKQRDELHIVESFFRINRHIFLRVDDEWPAYKALFQLAIEHADDSPLTLAAEDYLSKGYCDWIWLRNLHRAEKLGYINGASSNENQNDIEYVDNSLGNILGIIPLPNDMYFAWDSVSYMKLFSSSDGSILAENYLRQGNITQAMLLKDLIVSFSELGPLTMWRFFYNEPLEYLLTKAGVTYDDLEEIVPDILIGLDVQWDKDEAIVFLLGDISKMTVSSLKAPFFRNYNLSGFSMTLCWNFGTGQWMVITQQDIFFNCNQILCIDNSHFLTRSDDCFVRLWDSYGKAIDKLNFNSAINGMAQLNNGNIIVWTKDCLAHVCQIYPLNVIRTIEIKLTDVGRPQWDDNKIITTVIRPGSRDKTIVETPDFVKDLLKHQIDNYQPQTYHCCVHDVIETSDNKLIIMLTNGRVAIWSCNDWQPIYPTFDDPGISCKESTWSILKRTLKHRDNGTLSFGMISNINEKESAPVSLTKIIGSLNAGCDKIISWSDKNEFFFWSHTTRKLEEAMNCDELRHNMPKLWKKWCEGEEQIFSAIDKSMVLSGHYISNGVNLYLFSNGWRPLCWKHSYPLSNCIRPLKLDEVRNRLVIANNRGSIDFISIFNRIENISFNQLKLFNFDG